jgi:hypothetical protein
MRVMRTPLGALTRSLKRYIIEQSQPPNLASLQHTYLLLFAAFQLSGTPMAADAMSGGFNKLIDLVDVAS